MLVTKVVVLHLAVLAKKFGDGFPSDNGHGLKSILSNSRSTEVAATYLV